jgi:hypothetical protein
MIARKAGPIHPSIEGARQRFDLWRRARSTSSPTSPIPEALWALAVKVTSAHGINKTAQALRLNYNALNERVKAEGGARGISVYLIRCLFRFRFDSTSCRAISCQ